MIRLNGKRVHAAPTPHSGIRARRRSVTSPKSAQGLAIGIILFLRVLLSFFVR